MQTARELLVHELGDLLSAEQQILKALGEMEKEATLPELKKGFGEHRRQTEGQIKRLQQVFESLDEKPRATECKGMKGLIEERKAFKEEDPSDDIMAIFDCGATIKVESYEINAYNSVIALAEQLGLDDAIDLLQQTLDEEEAMLERVQDLEAELEPEMLGMGDDDDEAEELSDEETIDITDDEDEEVSGEADEDAEAEEQQPAKKGAKSAPKKGKTRKAA
jgi:ferritin-like metal-binding protein YciE